MKIIILKNYIYNKNMSTQINKKKIYNNIRIKDSKPNKIKSYKYSKR